MAAPNIVSFLDPSLAADQTALERQQALAALLAQKASQPIQANESGRIYAKVSPWQGLAQLGQAYMAAKMGQQADKGRADMSNKSMQALMTALGGQPGAAQSVSAGAMGGDFGPGESPNIPMQGSTGNMGGGAVGNGGIANLANLLKGGAIGQLGGDSAASAYYDQFKLPEQVKSSDAYGLSRGEVGSAMRAENATKGVLNPHAGTTLARIGPDGQAQPIFSPPNAKDGTFMQWQNGMPSVSQIPGAAQAASAMKAAEGQGEGMNVPYPTLDAQGNPQPIQSRTAVLGGPQVQTPIGPAVGNFGGNPQQVQQQLAAMPPGPQKDAAMAAFSAQQGQRPGSFAAPPMGAAAGAEAAQKELSQKYIALNEQNQQAQSTTSYLQSIKSLAAKAATGPQSDKLQFTNGLLSLVGNERATDAVTANNLMDKYANQITARLGQGGLGTDAARSILQSAYPNSKMNVGAINEAVDNLVGANEMVKAKTRFLGQHADARNPVAYGQAERAFDQAADPRIFQLQNMTPADQASYVQRMSPAIAAQILQQRKMLKEMGVL